MFAPAGGISYTVARTRFVTLSDGSGTPTLTTENLLWDHSLYGGIPGQAVPLKVAIDATDSVTGHTTTLTATPTGSGYNYVWAGSDTYSFPGGGGCGASAGLTLAYQMTFALGSIAGAGSASYAVNSYPSVGTNSGCPGGSSHSAALWSTASYNSPEGPFAATITGVSMAGGGTVPLYSGGACTLTAVEH
jgi:hypothetical protein